MTQEELLRYMELLGHKPEDYGMTVEQFLAEVEKAQSADYGLLSTPENLQGNMQETLEVGELLQGASTLEDIQAIGADYPDQYLVIAQRANELGIPLASHVGGERYAVTDLGFKPDDKYFNYLERNELIPDTGKYGWETHRNTDGSYRVSIDEPEPSTASKVLSVAVPAIIASVSGGALAAPLAATLGVSQGVASGIISAGLEAAQGGDLQDALTAGLLSYGFDQSTMDSLFASDTFNSALETVLPDSVMNSSLVDGVFDAADFIGKKGHEALSNTVGLAAEAFGLTTEEAIIMLNQAGEVAGPSGVGAILDGQLTIPKLYDLYNKYEGEDKLDIPIVDPGGGLPQNPDAGGSSSSGGNTSGGLLADPNNQPSGGLLEQPHIPNDTTGPEPLTQQQKWDAALEEYWAKNPDELNKAVQNNPEAFGGLLGEDSTFPPADVGWKYMGGRQWKNMETGEKIKVPHHPELGAGNTVKGEVYPFPQYTYDKKAEEPAKETIDMPILTTGGYSKAGFPDHLTNAPDGSLIRKDGQPVTQEDRYAVRDWGLGQAVTEGGYNLVPYSGPPIAGTDTTGGDTSTGGGTGGGTGDGVGTGDGSGQQPDPSFDPLLIFQQMQDYQNAQQANITPYERQQYNTTGYSAPDYGSYGTSQYNGMEGGLIKPMVTAAENSGQPDYDEWGMGYGLLGEDERRKQNLGLI